MTGNSPRHSYIFGSLKGLYKKDNEDTYLAIDADSYYIFAIFDGVGSARNSKLATLYAKEFIEKNHSGYLNEKTHLDKLMYDCNRYILNQHADEAYTTYCAVVICKDETKPIVVSHMGDSRIYTITNQYIDQLTRDDKLSSTNIVTKCLGMENLETYDFHQKTLTITPEKLLLCTDGFYRFLEEDRFQFFEIMNKKNLKLMRDALLNMVEYRNTDDATFVLIK